MDLFGVRLKLSTSKHLQTDSYTEKMNRTLANYLGFYCNYHMYNWDVLLVAAKFASNSAHVGSKGMPSFEADLGWKPRSPLYIISELTYLTTQRADDLH